MNGNTGVKRKRDEELVANQYGKVCPVPNKEKYKDWGHVKKRREKK